MLLRISLIFFLSIFSFTIWSQEDDIDEYEEVYEISRVHLFDVNFSTYFPTGAFKENVDQKRFYGFSLAYLYQLEKEKPAFLGAEFYHMNFGSFSRSYEAAVSNEFLNIDGRVSSNIFGGNAIIRYYPKIKLGPIESFFEGQFGGKWLYTYLSETGVFSDDEAYSNFDYLDGSFALVYGGAIGIQVAINENFYLSFKGSYSASISTEYYKRINHEPNVILLFPEEGFEHTRSDTDVVKLDLGLTFVF